MNKKYMVLDTETSGFKLGQICQLSYITFDENFKILKTFNQYFVVESVDEWASNVHGLTVEKLKTLSGGKIFKDKPSLAQWI
jgi:DNA polymerase III epsilon subunit-like protein